MWYNTFEVEKMDYHKIIIRDPQICGGQPVIRNTRVPLHTILASLASGDSVDDILKDFPSLTKDDIEAVIAFAASSAQEDLPTPGIPSTK